MRGPAHPVFLHVCAECDVLFKVRVERGVTALVEKPFLVLDGLAVVNQCVVEDVQAGDNESEHPEEAS